MKEQPYIPFIENANVATLTSSKMLSLQISISIGNPVLSSSSASIGGAVNLLQEGLFSSSPPAIDTAPFYQSALFDETFSWKAALSLALASKLAYEGPHNVEQTCLGGGNTWGFSTCEFLDMDDTQCFVATTPEIALVSFRGTESRGDWLRNINVPGRTRDYGVVHRGFLGAFQAIESRLRSVLAGMSGKKLILTGHSLGGAIATVMAAEWQNFMPAYWVVTFGQPAVGSGAFRMFFLQRYSRNFFRFVNNDDIVSRVPPGYQHVGRLFHFNARGNLQTGQSLTNRERTGLESPQLEPFEQGLPMLTELEYQWLLVQLAAASSHVGSGFSESVLSPTPEGFFPSFTDHRIDNYIAKLAEKTVT